MHDTADTRFIQSQPEVEIKPLVCPDMPHLPKALSRCRNPYLYVCRAATASYEHRAKVLRAPCVCGFLAPPLNFRQRRLLVDPLS